MTVKLAVPSYIWKGDNTEWSQCIAAKPNFCVINPNNGPGQIVESEVVNNLLQLRLNRTRILFYVDTNYGARENSDVISEAATAFRLYSAYAKGIFWDRIQTSVLNENYDYHAGLSTLAQRGGLQWDPKFYGLSVFNPGTGVIGASRMKENTIWCTFEGRADTYLANTPPPMPIPYRAREWHIIYGGTLQELAACAKLLRQNQIGYGYLTRDDLPNPFDTFDEEACKLIKQ